MTSYYKGNNIGLNYDAANATWSFDNEPNDFIDPASFSTAEPAFDYTPPPSDDDDQEDTTCPPGYIYDETLKQCVPDPNVNQQAGYQQDTGGGQDRLPVRIAGTSRTTSDNNFIATDEEYDAMSPAELLENYKQRGYVTKSDKGELVVDLNRVDLGGNFMDNLLGKVGGGGETSARKKKLMKWMLDKQMIHSDLNPNLMNFKPLGMGIVNSDNFPMTRVVGENAKIVIPTKNDPLTNFVSGTTKTLFTAGFGDATYLDRTMVSRQPQFGDITTDYNKKIQAFNTASMNKVVPIKIEDTGDAVIAERIAAKERRDKFNLLKDQAAAEKAKLQAEKEQANLEKAQKEKERRDFEDLQPGQSVTDSSGDTYTKKDDGGYTFTPSKQPTKDTKTYTSVAPGRGKQTRSEPSGGKPQGNPMGVQSKPSVVQSGPKPGQYGWQR
jgi:hypothetical protein